MVDEDAGELVADRLVDQDRRDRRIDAAREAADHAGFADLRADAGDLLGAKRGHRPVALEARDFVQEIGDEFGAVGRVDHLGVEHGGVVAPLLVRRDRIGRVLGHGVDAETLRELRYPVAMAHPHRIAPAGFPHALEQGAAFDDLDIGAAEFRRMPALDLAAELFGERLLAVADGENRHGRLEDFFRRARAARFRRRGRPARQDHRLRLQPLKRLGGSREGMDLAIDAGLAHAARDQLRHLRAEVHDEDGIMLHDVPFGRKRGGAQRRRSPDRTRPAFVQTAVTAWIARLAMSSFVFLL